MYKFLWRDFTNIHYLIFSLGTGEMHKHGQVLVVPHPDLKNSLSGYLYSGDTTERKSGMHKADWSVEEWKLAITEVSSHSVSSQ